MVSRGSWGYVESIHLTRVRVDIDYMDGYRDFTVDPYRYSYAEGEKFLDKLHASGRHLVPIVDGALYIPNPQNASDA